VQYQVRRPVKDRLQLTGVDPGAVDDVDGAWNGNLDEA